MKSGFLVSTVLAATSLSLVASGWSPANAFSISKTGTSAGAPAQPLWQLGITQSDIGKVVRMGWSLDADFDGAGGLKDDLSAFTKIRVLDFTKDYIDLKIRIGNLTNLVNETKASILSFGFGVDPDAKSAMIYKTGKTFDYIDLQGDKNPKGDNNQNFTGGFKNIDVCLYPSASSCSGGNVNLGLAAGAKSEGVKIRIDGNFLNQGKVALTLSDFPIKFQTSAGSYELAAYHAPDVPEPLTVIGTGMALGFGFLFKRESNKKRDKASAEA